MDLMSVDKNETRNHIAWSDARKQNVDSCGASRCGRLAARNSKSAGIFLIKQSLQTDQV